MCALKKNNKRTFLPGKIAIVQNEIAELFKGLHIPILRSISDQELQPCRTSTRARRDSRAPLGVLFDAMLGGSKNVQTALISHANNAQNSPSQDSIVHEL